MLTFTSVLNQVSRRHKAVDTVFKMLEVTPLMYKLHEHLVPVKCCNVAQ